MEEKTVDYSKLGQERVLNIRELIFECVRKWWIMLIFAIAFAGLLGAFKYQRDLKSAKDSASDRQQLQEADLESIREGLSGEQLMEADYVVYMKKSAADLQEYMENSLLMQMNQYNNNIGALQYYIDNDYKADYSGITEKDYSIDLREAYQAYIANGGLASDLQKSMLQDVETQYVNELFDMRLNSENSFTLKIIGRDKQECQELVEQAQILLEEYQNTLNSQIAQHQLRLVMSSYSNVMSDNFVNQRNSKQNTLQEYLNRITARTEELDSDQKKYVDAMLGMETEEAEESLKPASVPTVHISKKYVAVGGIGGIIVAAMLIIFVYLMRGTVSSAEDIQYLYNIKILGKLGKARMFSGMNPDETKQLQLLFVNIKTMMDMKQAQQVYVSGSILDKLNQEQLERIQQQAKELKLELEFGENFLYQPESLERMLSCDAVILLEKERVSKYTDIVNEYRICMEYHKELLGMVMFV